MTKPDKHPKIEFASTAGIQNYPRECAEFLHEVFGEDIGRVFVSDLSTVKDFHLDDEEIAALSHDLGVPISGSDYVLDVCKRLAKARAN